MKRLIRSACKIIILILTLGILPFSVFAQDDQTLQEAVEIIPRTYNFSLGYQRTGAVEHDNSLWMWGNNDYGNLGDGSTDFVKKSKLIRSSVAQVVSGKEYHSGFITTSGELYMMGRNNRGQLGNKTFKDCLEPVYIMNNVKQLSIGANHTAVVKNDGSLWIWGDNESHQVDPERLVYSEFNTPQKVMDDVAQVSLGSNFTVALKKDGTVWTWGANDKNQLGTNDPIFPYKKNCILDNAVAVEAGYDHAAVIKNDGTLWIWGDNSFGKLGLGYYADGKAPQQLADNVLQALLGRDNTAFIKDDNTLWICGSNSKGQFGNGTLDDSAKPIQVAENVNQVCLGESRTGIVKNDKGLRVAGENYYTTFDYKSSRMKLAERVIVSPTANDPDSNESYEIKASVNPSEAGKVEGDGTYEEGETVSLRAIANNGYRFVNWTENGNEVSTSEIYSFEVSSNRDLVANFEENVSDNNSSVQVYRIYNEGLKEHLYTTEPNEVNVLTTTAGWKSEGIGWESPNSGKPVYRLYSPETNYHLYTSDQNEVNVLSNQKGWQIDNNSNPLFYSAESGVPVYRLYNNDLRVHLLTTDQNEYNILGGQGWNQESVAFYTLSK